MVSTTNWIDNMTDNKITFKEFIKGSPYTVITFIFMVFVTIVVCFCGGMGLSTDDLVGIIVMLLVMLGILADWLNHHSHKMAEMKDEIERLKNKVEQNEENH